MYVSNVVILIGVFISSGSAWTLVVTGIVGVYYFRSARSENRLLADLCQKPSIRMLTPQLG